MNGFSLLGPGGAPAIPELVRIARETNGYFAQTAVYVLAMIGDEAVPVIFDVLTNRQAYPLVPPSAIGGANIYSITNKGPVLKTLTACLKSGDAQVRRNATTMLGTLMAEPDLTVPALIGLLNDGDERVRYNAINALRDFRKEARPAAQSLLVILRGTEPGYMRDAITGTLKEIAPDVLTNGVKDF
jgi:HEAT repeat protein